MASLATAFWMGLAARDSARDTQEMWDLASRATRGPAQGNLRAADAEAVAQVAEQLRQALAERDAWRDQCVANYAAWEAEAKAREKAQKYLGWLTEVLSWSSAPRP